jgi:hydroxypyruvate isomerase
VSRLAANCSLLFTDRPFLDRLDAASAHGFTAVEWQFAYDHEPGVLAKRTSDLGIRVVLFNAPAGDFGAGDRGLAALPSRTDEFREGIARAADHASAVGCPSVHVMAGIDGDRACYVDNLAWASEMLATAGAVVTIEPLNGRDVPGYTLQSSALAVQCCAAAGRGVRLQADLYHLRLLGEDPTCVLDEHLPLIQHVQIAGVPDRHEPVTDEDRALLGHLDALGYGGWVGCEYVPLASTESGLGWARQYGISPSCGP